MDNIIKFGLVGCGRISSKHFDAVSKLENAEVVACVDIIKQRAVGAAAKYNIKSVYSSYEKLLADENLDAVLICTPSGLHPEMGIQAAEKKLHVITEKPMAINLKSADALVKACDRNNVQLFVVKQNRLNPTIRLLKRAIDKNRFGRLFSANATVRWSRPQSYYDLAKWRGTWEFDGGAFMNQASHYFDLIQWLMGPIESVMAFTNTINHSIETEDQGTGIIHFRNGALGTIEVSMNIFPRNFEGSITIMGESGTVKIGGIAVNKIEHWEFKDYDDDDKLIEEAATNPENIYGFGHTGFLKNVIDSLQGKAEANTDGREGRKSLELILAMYESSRTGKRIALPLRK